MPPSSATCSFLAGRFVGTNTSEPGPGVGVLEMNSHFRRVARRR